MKFNNTLFVALAALGAASFVASCGTSSASMNPGERPRSLRYCFTSTAEEPDAASARLEVIQAYLSRTLHMPVEVTRTSNSYGAAIEAFRANKIDLASISPFSYVIATQKVPIEAILMRDKPEGGAGEYNGVLRRPRQQPHTYGCGSAQTLQGTHPLFRRSRRPLPDFWYRALFSNHRE